MTDDAAPPTEDAEYEEAGTDRIIHTAQASCSLCPDVDHCDGDSLGGTTGVRSGWECWVKRPFAGDSHEFSSANGGGVMLADCPKVVFLKRDSDVRPYGHATVPVFDNRKFGCQICIYDPARPTAPPQVIFSREDGQIFDRYFVTCHSGAQLDGRLDLSGDKTACFNMAYAHLVTWEGSRFCRRDAPDNPLVWWSDGNWGGQTGNYQPCQSGSRRSRLCDYPENGHGDVTVDNNSRRRVHAWIDS